MFNKQRIEDLEGRLETIETDMEMLFDRLKEWLNPAKHLQPIAQHLASLKGKMVYRTKAVKKPNQLERYINGIMWPPPGEVEIDDSYIRYPVLLVEIANGQLFIRTSTGTKALPAYFTDDAWAEWPIEDAQ